VELDAVVDGVDVVFGRQTERPGCRSAAANELSMGAPFCCGAIVVDLRSAH
jgi:hypothetical protein